ncbi:MAG: U32 family peptidase [Spirochaetaceae bacterium]|nr:U32 family peptidase [Spirochaetaceae bacterium]
MTRHAAPSRIDFELLAPAGTFEIFLRLLDSGADAFYCGGKLLNMRLHRKDYNLTDDELVEACALAHEHGKRFYVTVNKLMGGADLEALPRLLELLATRVHPDAIIVQDYAVIDAVNRMGRPFDLHASVMMNVHNSIMVRKLMAMGVSRVVFSRELPLSECARIRDETGVDTEYFVHGDMCVSNGSLCLYSGMLFGHSSNRGLCMKPCRWPYRIHTMTGMSGRKFPLAVKDMGMYPWLPELHAAGIHSLKIEGRMRSPDYVRALVDIYADAIDRFVADPDGYDRHLPDPWFEEHRFRDLSPAYAFGNPGVHYLNTRWEGTGRFYSTGKVFSVAALERPVRSERLQSIADALHKLPAAAPTAPELVVRVDTAEQARCALARRADRVLFSMETFRPREPVTPAEMAALRQEYPQARFGLVMPRMLDDASMRKWEQRLVPWLDTVDEVMVGFMGAAAWLRTVGQVHRESGRRLMVTGDYALNVFNAASLGVHAAQGLAAVCLSPELPLQDMQDLLVAAQAARSELSGAHQPSLEVVVGGRISAMYIDLDLFAVPLDGEAWESRRDSPARAQEDRPKAGIPWGDHTNAPAAELEQLGLEDERGQLHPVVKDVEGRCHLLTSRLLDLRGLGVSLARAGIHRFRLDLAAEPLDIIASLTAAWRAEMDAIKVNLNSALSPEPAPPGAEGNLLGLTHISNMRGTLGALEFDR